MTDTAAFAWPLTTIDFEASAFGEASYPIEIGIARWHGPGTPIRMWSSLIGITLAWRTRGNWNPDSAEIHKIPRSALENAPGPKQVMETLNTLCGIGTLAFCDGGSHDSHWLQRLADAAGEAPRLLLGSWGHLIDHLCNEARSRAIDHAETVVCTHRAGPDAVDHMKTIAAAIEVGEPRVMKFAGM